MHDMNEAWFTQLLAGHRPPCVSLYMPTPRSNPPAGASGRLFEELLKKIEAGVEGRWGKPRARAMGEKIRSIPRDEHFWIGPRDGIAIFASPDHLQVVDLPQPVDARVIVNDTFHVKPLIRILQADDRYQLLCLQASAVQMFEGTRFSIREIDLRNVPRSPAEVSGMARKKNVAAAHDLVEAPHQTAGGGNGAAPRDEFFRAVDKAVWENFSRLSRLPLILVAVEEHHKHFHDISHNQYLLPESVKLDPKGLSPDRMREEAWKIIEPTFCKEVEGVASAFRAARAHHRGSDEVMEVAEAAAQGRVGTLLVQSDVRIRGVLQHHSGQIMAPDLNHEQSDVLDDLAELVLRQDGQVLVLPQENMPTDTGVAAIYRY